jgi:CheY-like chemotaxis protein/anti-sigma regulatory factor (Ser/Thr protein kinase)
VVWNLLSNAVKFTPSGGIVNVIAQREGNEVRIDIVDTGIGIRAEFLPHVFDRFRQAEVASTRAHGGLGLGLAIAKELVELHAGQISVESEGPGRGTRFTIRMPLPARTADLGDTAAPVEEGYDLRGLDVILVEDEVATRDTMRRLLTFHGAKVRAVDSVSAALEAVKMQAPRVLVSDIGLPGEDGYSLIKQVRENFGQVTPRIQSLALTAFARPEDREHALASGFDDYLAKPVDADRLISTIQQLARR